MNQRDTICALATPPGVSGLAVIRISGEGAFDTADRFFSGSTKLCDAQNHTVHYGWWKEPTGRVDAITATVYRSPASYTGEDVIEVGCHGGTFVVSHIIQSLISDGARMAEPGEFTRRAFLNGKLDLPQVEAVADLIHAQTQVGAQTSARQLAGGFTAKLKGLRDSLVASSGLLEVELDFSEEGYEFVSRQAFKKAIGEGLALAQNLLDGSRSAEILRSGFYCAVVGFPNAGKSSLFNALLDRPRAIVSHIPGTTRDYLEESIVVDGYTIHLYDTAGLRDTADTIELQGILLTGPLLQQSNMVMIVNDASHGFDHSDSLAKDITTRYPEAYVVVVQNKMDIVDQVVPPMRMDDVLCSTTEAGGLDAVRKKLVDTVSRSSEGISDVLVNARQSALLASLFEHLLSTKDALELETPADLMAIDLRAAVRLLGEITGETWNPDILDSVFSQFCIGK